MYNYACALWESRPLAGGVRGRNFCHRADPRPRTRGVVVVATESVAAGAPPVSGAPASAEVQDKGLKKGAIGYLSNIVIGVASTAPAYSLATTLGFIVVVKSVGVHAPAGLLVAFLPMLLVASAYK